jgi:hypothetical protein
MLDSSMGIGAGAREATVLGSKFANWASSTSLSCESRSSSESEAAARRSSLLGTCSSSRDESLIVMDYGDSERVWFDGQVVMDDGERAKMD